MIPDLALLYIVFVTLDKVLLLSNLYFLICEKGMIVAPTHGVVRMKKENVSEVCGIVSGTHQVLSECWLFEASTSSPVLHVTPELGVLWSTDVAATLC